MTELDTKPFLDAGTALRNAIMNDYQESGAAPGAHNMYRTMEYSKGRDHVDLGLLRGALGNLNSFQAAIKAILSNPLLTESLAAIDSTTATDTALRDRYDDFLKHMKSSYQPTADGNQIAVGLIRDLSTLALSALVLKTACKASDTSDWESALSNALGRWETALSSSSRRLFASSVQEITGALDSVANALQERGMLRLAYYLDTVSNAITIS